MKKIILLFFVLVNFSIFAQITSKNLADFSSLSLQGRMQVFLKNGSEFKVEINAHGDAVDLDKLIFKFKGNNLDVKYQGGSLKDIDLILTFYIPSISSVEARQGVEVRTEDKTTLNGDKLNFYVFAGGKIAANVNCSKIKAEINQGGSIRLTGNAKNELECNVFTGGTIATVNLDVKDVNAKITMGGEIITYAKEKLDAKVTSGGTISYKGSPVVTQKIVLGGTVEKL